MNFVFPFQFFKFLVYFIHCYFLSLSVLFERWSSLQGSPFFLPSAMSYFTKPFSPPCLGLGHATFFSLPYQFYSGVGHPYKALLFSCRQPCHISANRFHTSV